ncbi:hypothetical protein V1504DRAFT_430056 [Lipomyces starkeyi]
MVPDGDTALSEDECTALVLLLCALVRDFIRRSFPGMNREACKNDRVLQACNVKKFSVHCIHLSRYFDNAVCSMLAFVYELQHFPRTSVEIDAVDDVPAIGVPAFRLVGNTKLGARRPLASYRDFLESLVTDRNADLADYVYSVKPHPRMPLLSVHRAQLLVYGSADATTWIPQPDSSGLAQSRRVRQLRMSSLWFGEKEEGRKSLTEAHMGNITMVDDDEVVVLENGTKVSARELGDQQVVFCPVCDTKIGTSAGQRSELSDTFNRHFWLHKAEFRLSQIRMVELDEETTINELTDEGLATVDMVTE